MDCNVTTVGLLFQFQSFRVRKSTYMISSSVDEFTLYHPISILGYIYTREGTQKYTTTDFVQKAFVLPRMVF